MTTQVEPTTITETPETYTDVLASVLRCAFAGVGAALVVGIATHLFGYPLPVSLTIAFFVWGNVAGLMIFWTSTKKPITEWWQWEELRLENDALQDALEYLESKVRTLDVRNQYLETENQRLTVLTNGTTNYVPKAAASDPVRRDAQVLIDVWAAGGMVAPTQRQMMEQGWSQARYAAARAYLVGKHVIGEGNRGEWKVDTREAAQLALNNGFSRE